VIGFLSANNHKTIGLRFIVTALAFFGAAGVMGGLMRHQLATANSHLVGRTSTTSCSRCTARR
jgi:heme/copper-type cytochrome/quinol oxidase subunit 1